MIPQNKAIQQQCFTSQQLTTSNNLLPRNDEKIAALSMLIFSINTVHGGSITSDKMIQLQELGITDQQLHEIKGRRSQLLGGMKKSPTNSSGKTSIESLFDCLSMAEPAEVLSIPYDKIQLGRKLGKGLCKACHKPLYRKF